jgi:hypothetical protein
MNKSIKMKRILPLAFIFLLLCTVTSFSQKTEVVFLSGTDADNTVEWEFFCTDGRRSGEWTTIPVPSNWELQGFGTYNYGHDWNNKNRTLGKEHGLYKHTFNVPASWKGKTINIVFDGAMTDTKVKINGKAAGEMHQGGFYRFKYDISNLVRYGRDNVLEVDVANIRPMNRLTRPNGRPTSGYSAEYTALYSLKCFPVPISAGLPSMRKPTAQSMPSSS